MKCIAAIEPDLSQSAIGTRSRLDEHVRGVPVLTRTIRQLCAAARLDHLFVLAPPDQLDAVQALLPAETNGRVTVQPQRVPAAPYRNLIRTARKWSLDGWRGGLGGTTSMDEYTRTAELAILAHEQRADALFCASAASPLIDPKLIDTLCEHYQRHTDEARIAFTQAPPGLAGVIYQADLLIQTGREHMPPGMVLSYKPDKPMMDLAHKSCCYTAPAAVRHAAGRLIADTDRAVTTIAEYLETDQPIDAERIGEWLIQRERAHVPPLPREVEIELTTDDQLPDTLLHPRGQRVGARGPLDLAVVERIASEMATLDDSLVVLGGFGEPLLHPQFDDVLAILRQAGVYGICVRTSGLALDDARIEALFAHRVDVLNVLLDAWTADTYARVHGRDGLERVKANLQRLNDRRAAHHSAAPLIVPEMTKAVQTLDEMDPFFDGWVRETGSASIVAYNHYARQLPDHGVMDVSPPTRVPCRRLHHRMTVLADGGVPLCDQDFTGRHIIARLHDQGVADVWLGQAMRRARARHHAADWNAGPLCMHCTEWHRGY